MELAESIAPPPEAPPPDPTPQRGGIIGRRITEAVGAAKATTAGRLPPVDLRTGEDSANTEPSVLKFRRSRSAVSPRPDSSLTLSGSALSTPAASTALPALGLSAEQRQAYDYFASDGSSGDGGALLAVIVPHAVVNRDVCVYIVACRWLDMAAPTVGGIVVKPWGALCDARCVTMHAVRVAVWTDAAARLVQQHRPSVAAVRCLESVTDAGLAALASLPSVVSIDVRHCAAVTNAGLVAAAQAHALPREAVEHVDGTGRKDSGAGNAGKCEGQAMGHSASATTSSVGGTTPRPLTSVHLNLCPSVTTAGLSRFLALVSETLTTLHLTRMDAAQGDFFQTQPAPDLSVPRLRDSHEGQEGGSGEDPLDTEVTHGPLLQYPVLTKVGFQSCGRLDGKALRCLMSMPALRSVSVADCPFVDDDAAACLYPPPPALSFTRQGKLTSTGVASIAGPGLTALSLNGCRHVTDPAVAAVAAVARGLTSLDLGGCRLVTAASLRSLCGARSGEGSNGGPPLPLSSLSIECGAITARAEFECIEELRGTVTTLRLGTCDAVPSDAYWALSHLTRLESLTLLRAKFLHSFEFFGPCTALTEFKVSHARVPSDGLADLAHLSALRRLSLSDSTVLDDNCVPHLGRIPGLRCLHITMCPAITDTAMRLIQHYGRPAPQAAVGGRAAAIRRAVTNAQAFDPALSPRPDGTAVARMFPSLTTLSAAHTSVTRRGVRPLQAWLVIEGVGVLPP